MTPEKELEQLRAENATLRHEFKMLHSGAVAQSQKLREAEAREAALIGALRFYAEHSNYYGAQRDLPGSLAFTKIERDDGSIARRVLANTSEQAKALIEVVEAAKSIVVISEAFNAQTQNRGIPIDHIGERSIRLDQVLAKLDKLTGGEK